LGALLLLLVLPSVATIGLNSSTEVDDDEPNTIILDDNGGGDRNRRLPLTLLPSMPVFVSCRCVAAANTRAPTPEDDRADVVVDADVDDHMLKLA
jgi:hypothetical protein